MPAFQEQPRLIQALATPKRVVNNVLCIILLSSLLLFLPFSDPPSPNSSSFLLLETKHASE